MFAKFLGVGVTAFIFDVTRPKLLEMEWFEKLYEFIMDAARQGRTPGRSDQAADSRIVRGDGDGWSSRMLRLIQRFRKSVHEAR